MKQKNNLSISNLFSFINCYR